MDPSPQNGGMPSGVDCAFVRAAAWAAAELFGRAVGRDVARCVGDVMQGAGVGALARSLIERPGDRVSVRSIPMSIPSWGARVVSIGSDRARAMGVGSRATARCH